MKRPRPDLGTEPIDATAADWVARCDRGLSPREKIELQQWRDADARNEEAFTRFASVWSAVGRPLRNGVSAELSLELQRQIRRQRMRHAKFAAMGALLALGFGVTSVWRTATPIAPATTVLEQKAPASVVMIDPERHELPDGSVVEHLPGAEIAVDFSGPLRRVTLRKGEALFEVAKNPDRPFVVEAEGINVRAVGTAFTVQLARDAVEVLVTSGTVRVDAAGDDATGKTDLSTATLRPDPAPGPSGPAVLTAGQRLVMPLERDAVRPPIATLDATELAQRLAWRAPRVEFSGAPLGEVLEVLNRRNRAHFIVAEPGLREVRVSGLFRVDDPEAFSRLLESGFGIVSETVSPDKVILRRAPP